jgi:hypothetical protein
MAGALCSVIVVGIYTGIRLYGTIPMAIYFLQVLTAFDGLCADMLTFKMAGDVDSISSELLEKWRVLLGNTQQQVKLKRKQLKSCVPLRIKLGSTNFIEICTPLVILDFCVNQIVTLLLAS